MRRGALIIAAVAILIVGAAIYYRHASDARAEALLPDLVRALEAETRAYQQRDWPRPPLFGEPSEGLAWDHYREAVRLSEEVEDSLYHTLDSPVFDTLPDLDWKGDPLQIPEAYLPFADQFAPAIRAMVRGANCSRSGSLLRLPEAAEERAATAYHISGALSERAIVHALLLLERGEENEALDILLALRRAGEDCFRGGAWTDMASGSTTVGRVIRILSAAIARGRISEEGIRRVERDYLSGPIEPKLSRDLLEAAWLLEQWELARGANGDEEYLKGVKKLVGPIGKLFPDGTVSIIEGWTWLRKFEEEMAATMPVETSADLRKIGAVLKSRSGQASLVVGFHAGSHRAIYDWLPMSHDFLAELRHLLTANIALFRLRAGGADDPASISGLLPPGTPTTTSRGAFTWWSHPDAEATWIGIGDQNEKIEVPPMIEKMLERALAPDEDDD